MGADVGFAKTLADIGWTFGADWNDSQRTVIKP
jgi:hypothetical protein